MGRNKITILIENKINNQQIYAPVFYLIEINILTAFEAKNDEIFLRSSSPAASIPHVSKCTVWVKGKKIKFFKILEIDIFKFIFRISFKNKQFNSKHDHIRIKIL